MNKKYLPQYNWNKRNWDRVLVYKKKWRDRNKKHLKEYRERNRDYFRNYYKKLRKTSPEYRINHNMARMLRYSIKEKNGLSWEKLVNYTLKDLMTHLEKLFDENMTWANYGSYWSIDHIKPRNLFKFETAKDEKFKRCWALNNLQPLEKITNIKKGCKY